MYERTSETIARINAAAAAQIANQGGIKQVVRTEVVGRVVGPLYPANRGGSLAGQPMRKWALVTHYSDGSTAVYAPKQH